MKGEQEASGEQLDLLLRSESPRTGRPERSGARPRRGARPSGGTDALLRPLSRTVRALVERAFEAARQDPERARRLPGYLRGLAAPETDPAARRALLELARRLQAERNP